MRLSSIAALSCTALLAACATPKPHVALPTAPERGAPFAARSQYFKDHALDAREPDHLFLHGGTRVYWPEDLLPAVDASSRTGQAIGEHVAARARVEEWLWLPTTGGVIGALGAVTMVGALGGFFLPSISPALSDAGAYVVLGGFVSGLALMGAATATVLVGNLIYGEDEQAAGEAADRAARTYPQSLADRVQVGVDANGLLFDTSAARADDGGSAPRALPDV